MSGGSRMRITVFQFFLFAPLFVVGCWMYPDTSRFPTNPPLAIKLAGIYRPTKETVKSIQRDGGYADRDMSILLNTDGTFHFENIPDWWLTSFGKPAGGFDSGDGTWNVLKHQNWWALELRFKNTADFTSMKIGKGLWTEANLIGREDLFDISLTVGDPDDGREMRFSRHQSN
jgi:hypothetical protein